MPRRLCALLALGLAAFAVPGVANARPAPRPTVVVALADSGINPYHQAFYRPGNTKHPCTYVAGFDCSIPALPLSIGKYRDYAKAVAADRGVWESVEPHQWYWIPRTNIIGAVCDAPFSDATSPSEGVEYCILDQNGHGTATAHSVLTEAPDALLLVHEGSGSAADLATAPVVPDVQSHSWGTAAPLPLHAADVVASGASEFFCDYQRRRESLFFLAAGNEAPFPSLADCSHYKPDIHVVGGGYPGYWTPMSWSTYDFASYFCRTVAMHDDLKGQSSHCGTSFSAPTAAGAAAAALLQLRRADRYAGRNTADRVSRTVTRAAFEQALRDGATYSPKTRHPIPGLCAADVCYPGIAYAGWTPLPPAGQFVFWGYGWLDGSVSGAIVACARGKSCPAKPADAQAWNDARTRARTTMAETRVVEPAPQRDAGSGRDAGDDRLTAVGISTGREYMGRVEPYGTAGDVQDWYTFRAKAGEKVTITATGYLNPALPADPSAVGGCWYVVAPNGRPLDQGDTTVPVFEIECDNAGVNEPPANVVIPRTGTYAAVYFAHNGAPPHDYNFTVTLAR